MYDELATGNDTLVVNRIGDDYAAISVSEVVVRAVSSRRRADFGTELDALPGILDVGVAGDVDVVPVQVLEDDRLHATELRGIYLEDDVNAAVR